MLKPDEPQKGTARLPFARLTLGPLAPPRFDPPHDLPRSRNSNHP